jgi:hypothetical protein
MMAAIGILAIGSSPSARDRALTDGQRFRAEPSHNGEFPHRVVTDSHRSASSRMAWLPGVTTSTGCREGVTKRAEIVDGGSANGAGRIAVEPLPSRCATDSRTAGD